MRKSFAKGAASAALYLASGLGLSFVALIILLCIFDMMGVITPADINSFFGR